MKAFILAGGLGTRLSEETHLRPKPMVEVGGRPILWHVMKIYAAHGITDFVILAGYKGHLIKEYFQNFLLHASDVTFDLSSDRMTVHRRDSEPWKVTVVDTGVATMTGGRLLRARRYIGDETFCLTYGDGVGDVPIRRLVDFHLAHGRKATVTAVQPPGRFGALDIRAGDAVAGFREKPQGDGSWINGGFFVLEPSVIDHVKDDACVWEREPLEALAFADQLRAFRHTGFWQPMDTLRDKAALEGLWESGSAPWKVW
ncbi:MAG: glucose-1-phosphate cytidylyltransferase [Verrucomicrobia bacterium]|nr:glucose-1-phosphate cytidylyltransferase [Verrucomicrobiota bacterium]